MGNLMGTSIWMGANNMMPNSAFGTPKAGGLGGFGGEMDMNPFTNPDFALMPFPQQDSAAVSTSRGEAAHKLRGSHAGLSESIAGLAPEDRSQLRGMRQELRQQAQEDAQSGHLWDPDTAMLGESYRWAKDAVSNGGGDSVRFFKEATGNYMVDLLEARKRGVSMESQHPAY